jgi:hypothetical protein
MVNVDLGIELDFARDDQACRLARKIRQPQLLFQVYLLANIGISIRPALVSPGSKPNLS